MHQLSFTTDPAAFLAEARSFLEADPVVATVPATLAERDARGRAAGLPVPQERPYWWLTVRDDAGRLVGAGMRTAPFEPHPLFLLPMPEDAARPVARVLHERGEEVAGGNGARPAVDALADELCRLTGREPQVVMHTRLFELRTLVDPAPVPGRLRPARPDELDLVLDWFAAFHEAADEQAGREAGHDAVFSDRDDVRRRVKEDRVRLWVDADDRPLHLTAFNEPAFGVARIGPVYTPPELRGQGYAGNAVAEVSRSLLDQGARPCLYTDQANPVSNRLYQALGYEAVVDQANLVLV